MFRAVIVALFLSFSLANGASAQSCAGLTTIVNGTNADATAVMNNFTALQNCINSLAMPRGYLNGLTLSNAGTPVSFSVGVGAAASDDAAPVPMKLAASITKTMAAWMVGNNNGALDTTDEMDKRFFHDRDDDCRNRVRPFFCSAAPRAILPSRPPISQPPRAGAVKAGRVCGHRKAWP